MGLQGFYWGYRDYVGVIGIVQGYRDYIGIDSRGSTGSIFLYYLLAVAKLDGSVGLCGAHFRDAG